MSNCLCNMFKGISWCCLGSMRVILFFGCVILAIIQLVTIITLFNVTLTDHIETLAGEGIDSREYLHAFLLFGLALIGSYGAFFKHRGCIRAFSILMALNTALLILMVIFTMSPAELEKTGDKIEREFEKTAPHYDWNSHSREHPDETALWDGLQIVGSCCGMKGPKDWDSNAHSGYLPASCCSSIVARTKTCEADSFLVHQEGCRVFIAHILKMSLWIYCGTIIFHSLLCVLACLVGNCIREDIQPRTVISTIGGGDQGSQNFQRFSGSVYVRQPAVNPQSYQTKPSPLYPDAHAVEKADFTAPPPSYGSVM